MTITDPAFLHFPMVSAVSAGNAPTVAWVIRQGGLTRLRIATAPNFAPVELVVQSDRDGQPISEIRVSPDGRHVAFVTGTAIGGRDDGYNPASLISPPSATVWIIEARSGAEPIKLGAGTTPVFTPDSGLLTYRRGRDLWAAKVRTPADAPSVLVTGGATFVHPTWSSNSKSLFFVQDRGGWSFLGRYDLGNDRITWLAAGASRVSSPALSPDGKTIAYFRWPVREQNVASDMYENEPVSLEAMDLETGTTTVLWRSLKKAGLKIADDDTSGLRWADDRTLVFRAEPDDWARLYAIARTGGSPRALTPPQCEVAESALLERGKLFVVHNCRDLDLRQISTFDISNGVEHPIKTSDQVFANAVAAGNGRWVAYAGADSRSPSLLRIVDARTGNLLLDETPATFGYTYQFRDPSPTSVKLKSTDGLAFSGQLFLPLGRAPHPAIVFAHGGPKEQMFPAFHYQSYYAYDYAINRRLAELGYVVLSVNFRSSTGYGRLFREAEGRAWRAASDYQDVLAAGRWLASRDDVDPRRIGIWGTSYGGFLTANALARNSDLFSAGVAVHGLFDWSRVPTIAGLAYPGKAFGVGPTQRNSALQSSPVAALNGWKSPVLLFSGDQDMNVDVHETIDLDRELTDRGVAVRTVILPGEAHRMIRQSSWDRLWSEQVRFFDENLAHTGAGAVGKARKP
ncbi:S9 family peptidase [Flavisphingomonas formosensis]|uniref:S9 family peptidase n=1 Tax=Flavisphingomonas formosensis TaxID=861534 RepID=UPI0018DF10B3|nr:prolyl oligopeptidase family serine peptidase [Sphingomonas formosensis]